MPPEQPNASAYAAAGKLPPSCTSGLRVLLDGLPLLPAYVVDFRLDVLARTAAAAAVFGEEFGTGLADNVARLLFLTPGIREAQLDWTRIARETVGNLRANLAQHREDPRLHAVIAEVRQHSAEFATWWDDHTVQERARGRKRVRHPAAGELALQYDVLAMLDGSGQRLMTVTPADPATGQALRRLVAARADRLGGAAVHAIAV